MTVPEQLISLHEVRVYRALLENRERWVSNAELADLVEGVALRTIRAYTRKFVELGLVDQARVFPGHRYRWSRQPDPAYVRRLEEAAAVFADYEERT